MTSRGWRGLGWLSPVEAVGGDLSRPDFLRCRGGGPREVAEDEGLPVLLGDRSVQTKGSTGRVAVWHTEAEEEKGKGGFGVKGGQVVSGRCTGAAEMASGR
jgi:hypothetical protein